MVKKILSALTASILVFSLIQITPTYAETITENNDIPATYFNNVAQKSEKEVINSIDTNLKSDEGLENLWARYMAEQEELVTPEIRASIRENVQNSFESHELTNRDFIMPGLSFSELGFTSDNELGLWLDKPFNFDEVNTMQGLTLSHYEYAVREGDFFCLRTSRFNNVDDLLVFSR